MTTSARRSRVAVLTIVFGYAAGAGLWIVLSDWVLGYFVQDAETLVRLSIAKGWLFVAVTTLLLFAVVTRCATAMVSSHERELAMERESRRPPPMLVAIADASTDAIFAKDQQGRYVLFNNAAARVVGRDSEQVIGSDDRALFPAEQAEYLMVGDSRIRSTGDTETREETLQTAEGERTFLATKGPLRAGDGAIFGTYGISRDITERKRSEMQLQESRVRLRALVDHAPVAVAMLDSDMRYLEVSQRWRDDYALGDGNIIGRSHYDVFPGVPEAWKAVHRRGLAGETLSSEDDQYQGRDGSTQWQRWEVRPWLRANGSVGGIVIFSEDITQRKAAEFELRQRNQELEHFSRVASERELRMVALKREINELARAAGRPAPYDLAFADAGISPVA